VGFHHLMGCLREMKAGFKQDLCMADWAVVYPQIGVSTGREDAKIRIPARASSRPFDTHQRISIMS